MNTLLGLAIALAVLAVPQGAIAQTGQAPDRTRTIALSELGETETAALLVVAQLALKNGQLDLARDMARRAFGAADSKEQKFRAALALAGVQARRENFLSSQLWLRRADQLAPNAAAKSAVAKAYKNVARANPLSLDFQFSVGPSDNVNNASRDHIVYIGPFPTTYGSGIDPLDGWEAEATAFAAYRLSQSRTHKTELTAQLYHRRIGFSPESAAAEPTLDPADFYQSSVILGISHREIQWPDLGPTTLSARVGQGWYAGEIYTQWISGSAAQDIRRENGTLQLSFSAQSDKRLDSALRDATVFDLGAKWFDRNQKGQSRSLGVSLSTSRSESDLVRQDKLTISGSHALGAIGPFSSSVSASISHAHYPDWAATADARFDTTALVSLTGTLNNVQYFGFVPRLNLTFRQVQSTINVFDRREVSIGISGQSRF